MINIASLKLLNNAQRRNSFGRLFILLLCAFFVSYIPFIHWPLKWMETFFHEISHGLAALITGGKIVSIEINWDGSGLCFTKGGERFWVAFSGYAGASLWGAFIFLLANRIKSEYAFIGGAIVVALMFLCAILWAGNFTTFFILILMLLPFAFVYFAKRIWIEKLFLEFSGLYVLLNSLKSPTYLFDGLKIGDGATLEKITGYPEFFWILLWFFLGMTSFVLILKCMRG